MTRPRALSSRAGHARPKTRAPLQPNTRSCGNQPAHISLDHASCNDTLTPTLDPTVLPHAPQQRDDVLTGVKAKPLRGGLRPALTPATDAAQAAATTGNEAHVLIHIRTNSACPLDKTALHISPDIATFSRTGHPPPTPLICLPHSNKHTPHALS